MYFYIKHGILVDNGASDDEDYYKGPSSEELRKKYAEDEGKMEDPSIEISSCGSQVSLGKPNSVKESEADNIKIRSYTNLPAVYFDHVYDDALPMDDDLRAFLEESQKDYKQMAELDRKLARPNPTSKHSVPYPDSSESLFLYPL